jgi:hypothetical protein
LRTASWFLAIIGSLVIAAPGLGQGDSLHAIAADSGQRAVSPRPRAIKHSDAYYTRLTIHRIGSYAILPIFGGEYLLGNDLLNGSNPQNWERTAHSAAAWSIGAIFAANTVTGVWNFIEARKDSEGRARRLIHLSLMLASDAGFLYTATLARHQRVPTPATVSALNQHRNAALFSIGLSTAGTVMMWLWRN